jgi:hypothetical protein
MINKKYKHVMIKLFSIYGYTHVETYTKMILNLIPMQELETISNIELDYKNIIHDYFLPKTQAFKEKCN